MNERRKFVREELITRVEVWYEDECITGELRDISLEGALFRTNQDMPMERGDICELSFYLTSSGVRLVFKAQLIRQTNNNYGFRLIGEDVDTFAHLQQLLDTDFEEEKVAGSTRLN